MATLICCKTTMSTTAYEDGPSQDVAIIAKGDAYECLDAMNIDVIRWQAGELLTETTKEDVALKAYEMANREGPDTAGEGEVDLWKVPGVRWEVDQPMLKDHKRLICFIGEMFYKLEQESVELRKFVWRIGDNIEFVTYHIMK